MKHLLIILVLVGALVGGFFYAVESKNKDNQTNQDTATPSLEQIALDKNSVQPPTNADQNQPPSPTTKAPSPAPAPTPVSLPITFKQPFAMTIDKHKKYSATLKTSVGEIVIDFTAAATPITVNNFVSLAEKHFYDKTIFHRVIKGFMIQGGDPKGDGTGGPGYRFDDESFKGEYTRGAVAMANAGPNTNGSQFFIMHGDVALPKNYVIFGHVVKGIEIVDAIAAAPVTESVSGEPSQPVTPVVVKAVEISEK